MQFNKATLARLFFTTLLNMALLIIGSIMYDSLFSTFVIALFASGLYLLVWELQVQWRLRDDASQAQTQKSNHQKRKRQDLDSMLHDLSDDDLAQLRDRLALHDDGEYGEDSDYVLQEDRQTQGHLRS